MYLQTEIQHNSSLKRQTLQYENHHLHVFCFSFHFLGIETFTGKYFHSRDYKTPEEWRNKRAVVIGIGNSGGDIAVELSRFTKQVRTDADQCFSCTVKML